jgi:predicted RNA-binding Zn ribbon-like protein
MNAERDLLLAFLQSSHANPEAWGRSPAGLAQWLIENGLAPEGATATDDDVGRARHLRAALTNLLVSNSGILVDPRTPGAIEEVTSRAGMDLRLTAEGQLALESRGTAVDRALAGLVATLYRAQVTGEFSRLKACKKCGWAFYDESKNRSRIWCDMALCGSQQKAMAYRKRQAESPAKS